MRFTKDNPLRVGTDCSGIEAPIMALKNLNIPFSHEFSSEIDKHCIASIKANYHPKIIFGDMTKRKLKEIPDIDLYVCGFPCQPFSAVGKQRGVEDPRGTIFWECLRVIKTKKPSFFILENVKGLLSNDNKKTFETMKKELDKLSNYHVEYKLLNTKDYGIPQSRARVFIVGIQKKIGKHPMMWPKPVKLIKPLKDYIDKTDTTEEPMVSWGHLMLRRIPEDACFINLSFSRDNFPNSNKICPCITCSKRLWCVPLHRRANTKEYLSLQGFPTHFKQVVTDNQLKQQVGNSMSVNVVEKILKMLVKCIN